KRLHRELGMTMLYATPDQLEALTMGERIGVIRDGKVVAVGAPRDLYQAPSNTYVARMIGSPPINFLDARAADENRVDLPFLESSVAASGVASGRPVTLGLRPQDLALAGGQPGQSARFPAKIHLTEPLGDVTVIDIHANDAAMKMVLREEVAASLSPGDDIEVGFNPADLHIFDAESGTRLGSGGAAV
ncbi:MAG: TOBE domain-containing protein, partial [Pseudomonadota bacterium]